MTTALVVDAHNLFWRVAARLPVLVTSKGEPVHVVFGFLKVLRKVVEEVTPDQVLVCWDSDEPSHYRRAVYPQYKTAHREHPQQALSWPQKPILKQVLKALPVRQLELLGVEADDIMAVACRTLPGKKVILSRDRDMYQLVSPSVSILSPEGKGEYKRIDLGNFQDQTGLTPQQYLEVQILVGDSGDGIPGVARGLGEKTISPLIQEFGGLGDLFWKGSRNEIRARSRRHALLYGQDVPAAIRRNDKLMDLSAPDIPEIREGLSWEFGEQVRLDKLGLIKSLKELEAETLLGMFYAWVDPFRSLSGEKVGL